jgi:hypothetical protein
MAELERLEARLRERLGGGSELEVAAVLSEYREAVRAHGARLARELGAAGRSATDASQRFLAAHDEITRLDREISAKQAAIITASTTMRRQYRECGLDHDDYLRALLRLETKEGLDELRNQKRRQQQALSGAASDEVSARERYATYERAVSLLQFYERIVARDVLVSRTCRDDWARVTLEERSFEDRLASLLLAVLYSAVHAGSTTAASYGSEFNMDTLAVLIVNGTLYAACNFKRRRFDGSYAGFGWENADCRALVRVIKNEGLGLERVRFLSPTPLPATAEANARPHAEMQLLSFVGCEQMRNRRVGVTKACCINCMAELDRAGAVYPYFAGAFANPEMNWDSPRDVRTRVSADFEVT